MIFKYKYRLFMCLCSVLIFMQGCFHDYTVAERTPVSGQLISSSERLDIAFTFDKITTFPTVKLRLRDFSDPNNRRIEVTEYGDLSTLNDAPGSHLEMWAVSENNQVSFGKFKQANGELYSFIGGVPGEKKCSSVGGVEICTFTPTDPNSPIFNDLIAIQISIEQPGDGDTVQNGSIALSGGIVNQNSGIVDPLIFPMSFSQNAITATAAMTLIAEDAKEGLLTLNLKNFPYLNNNFLYQLWSGEGGNYVSCGSPFNFKDGEIVITDQDIPKSSNVFSCGVDLINRSEIIISLEPSYEGNSASFFGKFNPYTAPYEFIDPNASPPPLNGIRASIAGAPRDRDLTDVLGEFSFATTALGRTYIVLRSVDFEPAFIGIDVKRNQAISGLSLRMKKKVPREALLHFFERDFDGPVSSVQVTSLGIFPIAMNDDGENGDLVKGDGVWTVRVPTSAGRKRYAFNVNGTTTMVDPHHENLDDPDTSTGVYTVIEKE